MIQYSDEHERVLLRGRLLLAFSVVAASFLVAESFATHPSSIQSNIHAANTRRRGVSAAAAVPKINRRNEFSSLFMSSQASTDEDEIIITAEESGSSHIIDAVGDSEDHVVQNTSKNTHTKSTDDEEISMWPQFDDLDKRMMKIALPCIANFAINPLIGAVDLFWVNRMSNALAVAGQAAANQVFSSAFWIVSFLPSVTATLVSKANAKGDEEEVQDAVSQALVVGFYVSLLGSLLMLRYPNQVLSFRVERWSSCPEIC